MINLGVHFKSSAQAIGAYAELKVAELLRDRGYTAFVCSRAGYDIRAINNETGEIIRIEVKVSRPNKDGKFRACLVKSGKTNAYKSDVVIFLCLPQYVGGEFTSFVIPTKALNGKVSLCVPKSLNSRQFSQYKENWSMF